MHSQHLSTKLDIPYGKWVLIGIVTSAALVLLFGYEMLTNARSIHHSAQFFVPVLLWPFVFAFAQADRKKRYFHYKSIMNAKEITVGKIEYCRERPGSCRAMINLRYNFQNSDGKAFSREIIMGRWFLLKRLKKIGLTLDCAGKEIRVFYNRNNPNESMAEFEEECFINLTKRKKGYE